MTNVPRDSYDEVVYTGYAYPQTHPNRLAGLAALFGMKPANTEHCRVLELACGDGNNLVPMASALPESDFIGIDIAKGPITRAREMVKTLGLSNIEFRQLDLIDLQGDIGQFDYIIAHGLYSWVPPAIQDKLLSVCQTNLAPEGVAFVSYNTLPGGHLRKMVREMMLYHVRDFAEPQQRIKQAITLMKFLAESQPHNDAYSALLKYEFEQVLKHREGHLYHDDLAETNSPVYFVQFMHHARQHCLQFLAEADFFEMQYHIYPKEASDKLRQMAMQDVVVKEQYLDFLKCRRFRQTLICHEGVSLNREPGPELIRKFFVASPAKPAARDADVRSRAVEVFVGKQGAKVATDFPTAKAALLHLGLMYPSSISFDDLFEKSLALSGANTSASDVEREEEADTLAQILFQVYSAGLLEIDQQPSSFVLKVSERPLASPLARRQIERDTVVTNLRHTSVLVEGALSRKLLLSLDGTRDRNALLELLVPLVESGAAGLQENGAPVCDPERITELLRDELEKKLSELAHLALLAA